MVNPNRYYSLEHRAMASHIDMHTKKVELDFKGVSFRYHDYIITSWTVWDGFDPAGFRSAVYQYDTDERDDNAPVTLVYLYDEVMDDQGDAVKVAIERAICIHAERLMKTKA